MNEFPHVFQPLRIKNKVFRNRLFFGPIQMSGIDGSGYPTDYGIDFFAARAHGGAALVTVGDTPVDSKYAPNNYRYFTLGDPGALPMLTELTESIRGYGAIPSIELNHAGAYTRPAFLKSGTPIGPTEHQRPDKVLVKGMNEELLHYTKESYCRAAAFAKLAGFEMITVCASDGWLLHQFLSPATNQRKDRYGGSLENRMRYPLEIIEAVRRRVGEDFLLELRLCANDFQQDGIRPEEAAVFALAAESMVDLVQVTAGSDTNTRSALELKPGVFQHHIPHLEYTRQIKQQLHIPVVANGGIMTPEEAEFVLASGWADAVGMCRALIAEPEFVHKMRNGSADDICPCIRCLHCLGDMQRTKQFRCTVNPRCGREYRLGRMHFTPSEKRIVVIGGGPAGLSAALSAARRGCRVTLFDRNQQLGGTLNRVEQLPYQADLKRYRDWLISRVETSGNVNVVLGVNATPELVKAQRADGVIAAIGARPSVAPQITEKRKNVMDESEIYTAELPNDGDMVVIGGGGAGCEAALFLAHQGRKVTLIDRNPHILMKEQPMLRLAWQDQLAAAGVKICVGINCISIGVNTVVGMLLESQTKVEIPADYVVFATGGNRDINGAELFRETALSFAEVGACIRKADLKSAVFDGYCAGTYI